MILRLGKVNTCPENHQILNYSIGFLIGAIILRLYFGLQSLEKAEKTAAGVFDKNWAVSRNV
jgi:hypothetical protein